jgi:hypothetical protein
LKNYHSKFELTLLLLLKKKAQEAAEVERWARVFEARESAAINHRLRQMMRERRAR